MKKNNHILPIDVHNCLRAFFLLVILLVPSSPSFSQTEKGSFLMGGSASFSSSKNADEHTQKISLTPSISYFLIDRLAIGPIISFGYISRSTFTDAASGMTLSIGPMIRYYFPIGEKLAIFPSLDYSVGWGYNKRTPPDPSNLDSSLFNGGIGCTYFITKSVGLEGLIYYQKNTPFQYIDYPHTDLTSVNLRFGLQIYLAKDKNNKSK